MKAYAGRLPAGSPRRSGWYRCTWCGRDISSGSSTPRACPECKKYERFAAVGKAS